MVVVVRLGVTDCALLVRKTIKVNMLARNPRSEYALSMLYNYIFKLTLHYNVLLSHFIREAFAFYATIVMDRTKPDTLV